LATTKLWKIKHYSTISTQLSNKLVADVHNIGPGTEYLLTTKGFPGTQYYLVLGFSAFSRSFLSIQEAQSTKEEKMYLTQSFNNTLLSSRQKKEICKDAYEVTNITQRREGGKRKTDQFPDSIQEDSGSPQKNSKVILQPLLWYCPRGLAEGLSSCKVASPL
jgi:hypothetical protein